LVIRSSLNSIPLIAIESSGPHRLVISHYQPHCDFGSRRLDPAMVDWVTKFPGCDADTGLHVSRCESCRESAARRGRVASHLSDERVPESDSKGSFTPRTCSRCCSGALKSLCFRARNGCQKLPIYIEQPSSVRVTTQDEILPLKQPRTCSSASATLVACCDAIRRLSQSRRFLWSVDRSADRSRLE